MFSRSLDKNFLLKNCNGEKTLSDVEVVNPVAKVYFAIVFLLTVLEPFPRPRILKSRIFVSSTSPCPCQITARHR